MVDCYATINWEIHSEGHTTVGVSSSQGSTDLGYARAHLGANRDHRERSCSLFVHQSTETRLALHNAVRDVHLAAERRQPDNELRTHTEAN